MLLKLKFFIIILLSLIAIISFCFSKENIPLWVDNYPVFLLYQDNPYLEKNAKILDITDNTISIQDNTSIKRFIKKDNHYKLVQNSSIFYSEPKKIAILYIATGRYIVFWENFYKSMEKHFLPKHKKTYFLFTEHDKLKVPSNVVKIHQDQLPWPYVTFKRFHFFDAIKDKLAHYDYIYFLNGDAHPVQEINEEIFPSPEQEVMVTLHSWYYLESKKNFCYDRNPKSISYIPYDNGEFYVTGAFNGGTQKGFLKMVSRLKEWTNIDIKNNITPLWHDESMLNKYITTYYQKNKPLILLPDYVITLPYIYTASTEFSNPKMVLVDKNEKGGREYLRGIQN